MKKQQLGITDLIEQIKEELITNQKNTNNPNLFLIDEITVEVNFVIKGDIDGGFNLGVVTLDSNISEEKVQKVILKMTPLFTKEQILKKIAKSHQQLEATTQALAREASLKK